MGSAMTDNRSGTAGKWQDRRGGAKPARQGAIAVGAFVPRIAGAVFQAHGFPSAAIVADWPAIAGPEFATFTAPERLIWPRRPDAEARHGGDASRQGSSRHRRQGATLVLRVDGPRALEVQHAAPQIIERVNTYFGYGAVAELRIIQAPVRRGGGRTVEPEWHPVREAVPEPHLDAIEDEGLRLALARLGARLETSGR